MGTMGAGLQQEHQVGLFEDEEPQEAFLALDGSGMLRRLILLFLQVWY